jgi:hypothetical protein
MKLLALFKNFDNRFEHAHKLALSDNPTINQGAVETRDASVLASGTRSYWSVFLHFAHDLSRLRG